jgi:hypothetical protein
LILSQESTARYITNTLNVHAESETIESKNNTSRLCNPLPITEALCDALSIVTYSKLFKADKNYAMYGQLTLEITKILSNLKIRKNTDTQSHYYRPIQLVQRIHKA